MNIYIPTRGRIGKQKTWSRLPSSIRKRTFLVCPPSEVTYHKQQHRNVLACPKKGIAAVRQWLTDREEGAFVMMDDDLYFYRRMTPGSSKLRQAGPEDIEEMFARVKLLSEQYPMVGVSARQGNDSSLGNRICKKGMRENYETSPGLVLNKKNCNFYGIRADVMKSCNIRFDAVPLMEDVHVSLSLIARGHDTAVITEWAWNQSRSGDTGGCSLYRNGELQKQAAQMMNQLHNPFVRVIRKYAAADNWKNVSDDTGYRYDIVVNWTGAVKAGKSTRRTLI